MVAGPGTSHEQDAPFALEILEVYRNAAAVPIAEENEEDEASEADDDAAEGGTT